MKPYYQRGPVKLYHADCLEWLPTLEPGSVDAVVTDPPYLLGSASTRRSAHGQSPVADWMNASRWYGSWLKAAFSAGKSSAPCWVCGTIRGYPTLEIATQSIGRRIISTAVWDKDWIGVGSMAGLRSRYELVFLIGNENFAIESRSEPDIWVHPWASKRPHGHSAEKPEPLFERMIRLSCPIGSVVCDPFVGSGTAAVAAINSGMSFIGCDLEESYLESAAKRCDAAIITPVETQSALFAEVST